MEIIQTTIQKTFTVRHGGKAYVVDYVNSDGPCLALMNRDNFEVYDEDGEELRGCAPSGAGPGERAEAEAMDRLADELVRHVVRHFFKKDRELLGEMDGGMSRRDFPAAAGTARGAGKGPGRAGHADVRRRPAGRATPRGAARTPPCIREPEGSGWPAPGKRRGGVG